MIDIDLMAEDFDQELEKVRMYNEMKRAQRVMQEIDPIFFNGGITEDPLNNLVFFQGKAYEMVTSIDQIPDGYKKVYEYWSFLKYEFFVNLELEKEIDYCTRYCYVDRGYKNE